MGEVYADFCDFLWSFLGSCGEVIEACLNGCNGIDCSTTCGVPDDHRVREYAPVNYTRYRRDDMKSSSLHSETYNPMYYNNQDDEDYNRKHSPQDNAMEQTFQQSQDWGHPTDDWYQQQQSDNDN
jgi:hypothetical protein